MLTYCISGFACNGKTSIIKAITGFIPKEYRVITMGEVARNVLDIRSLFSNLGNLSTEKLEMEILSAEHHINYLISAIDDTYVFLKDRHIFDVLTFMVMRGMATIEDVLKYDDKYGVYCTSLCRIVFLIKGTNDTKFISKCMSDDVRKNTLDDFIEMQDKFYEIWKTIYNGSPYSPYLIELEHPADNPSTPLAVISEILNDIRIVERMKK